MTKNQLELQNLQSETLQDLIHSLEINFPKELDVKDFYSEAQTTWAIPEIGLSSKIPNSRDELLGYVTTVTETPNIRLAYATVFEEIERRKSEKKS